MQRAKALRSHTHDSVDVRYIQTSAERTVSVTPTNYAIPSPDFIGFVLPQRYGWSTSATGAVNYTALVAAAAVAAQVTCGVLFPAGTFAYTPSAKIDVPGAWLGQGRNRTIINVAAAYAGECFRVLGHAGMRDMAVTCVGAAKTAGSIGVRISNVVTTASTSYQHLQDFFVDGFEKNLDFQNVTVVVLINVTSSHGTYGEYCVPDPAGGGLVTTIKHINCDILQNTQNVLFNPSVQSIEVSYDGGAIEDSTGSSPQASFTNMASLRFGGGFYTEGNSSQPWLELISVGQLTIDNMTNVSGGRITCGDNSTVGSIRGYAGQGANAKLVIAGTTCKFTIADSQFAATGSTFPANTRLSNTTINGQYYPNNAQESASYTGPRSDRFPVTGTTPVAGAGATDCYRFLDIAGTLINSTVAGTFYIKAVDNASGANQATYEIDITSNNNTTTDATLFPVRRQVRGTDPGVSAMPFTLANDGASGAVKLQFTKNAAIAQVNLTVVFMGLSI